jgi:RNA polymerase sigma-70 factor (ECF subfamily)
MDAESEVRESVDHLFRQNAGQMVSVLARHFGVEHIDLIEDAVQDAMIAAMRKWPIAGLPGNQTAWLIQVAKNRVIDQLRRGSKWSGGSADDDGFAEPAAQVESDLTRFEGELDEDQLRMIFACCSPVVPPDSQVALTLKIVSGFGVGEISRAYLAKDETVAKMLTRAKHKLRTASLEIPAGAELRQRLDSVLRVLYLMFNEGYAASEGEDLIRRDLCFEAIRLAELIASHTATSLPKVHALASLFHFQAARLATRTDVQGDLLLLSEQDRSKWDKRMLATGMRHFRLAATGNEFSEYHLEAEIASLHAMAPEYAATDWARIASCYDELQSRRFSPVVELNRIVAVGHLHGSERALAELRSLGQHYMMASFNLFHITLAHFLAENGNFDSAAAAYQKALDQTRNESVRRFLRRKIAVLTSSG